MFFCFGWFVLSYNKYRTAVPTHKSLCMKRPQAKTVPYYIYMITSAPPLYIKKRHQLKQYHITITKTVPYYNHTSRVETVQYIRRYYCPFFLPAAREPYCTPGTPYKLFGNTYIIIYMSTKQRFLRAKAQYGTADVFFSAVIYIIRASTVICSDEIYIYIFMRCYLHHRNVTERQFLVQPERRKDNDHQQYSRFLFFVFCFFFTVVWKQGLK